MNYGDYLFIDKIRLKDHEINKASGARTYLMQILQSKAQEGFIPTVLDIFLTGSYRRGTKITPLNDVDLFYVIGKAVQRNNEWHAITECSYSFRQPFLDADNNISSIKVLELIKGFLKGTYTSSDIKRNGEVVNLYLSSYDLGLDIVPAFEIVNSNYYLIPNGHNSSRWKKSNPHTDEKIVNTLNNYHSNLFKDVLRVTKHWFKKKKIVSPRSYHLEASGYHIFSALSFPVTTHKSGLITLFKNLPQYLSGCQDPTGLSEVISSDLSDDDILKIQNEIDLALIYLANGENAFKEYIDG